MSNQILDTILRNNIYTVQLSSVRYIIKLLRSIANKKGRYRILKKKNPVIKKYIVNITGMSDVLYDCGYHEEDTLFRFEKNDPLIIDKWISNLESHLGYIQKNPFLCLSEEKTKQLLRKKCVCGIFWGNPRQNDLCSLCYQHQQSDKRLKAKQRIRKLCIFMRCYSRLKRISQKPKQTNQKRCFLCNKKVGYLGFECNCGYIFCEQHRFPMQHHCYIDYKLKFKKKLKKENKKIIKTKIDKI